MAIKTLPMKERMVCFHDAVTGNPVYMDIAVATREVIVQENGPTTMNIYGGGGWRSFHWRETLDEYFAELERAQAAINEGNLELRYSLEEEAERRWQESRAKLKAEKGNE